MILAHVVYGKNKFYNTDLQDVIKSRIQADDICPKKRAYRNAYHCLKISIQNEGYSMLLRGIGSTIVR